MNIHLPFPYDGNQVCGGLLSSISSDFLGGIHGPHLISLPEHRTQRGVLPPRTGGYMDAHLHENSPTSTFNICACPVCS